MYIYTVYIHIICAHAKTSMKVDWGDLWPVGIPCLS
jgi:hypothetical protein